MDGYIGFGSASFSGAPIVLSNPASGALATALAAVLPQGAPVVAKAYRIISITGNITVTDSRGTSATWAGIAGQGEAYPIKDIVAASAQILVFY